MEGFQFRFNSPRPSPDEDVEMQPSNFQQAYQDPPALSAGFRKNPPSPSHPKSNMEQLPTDSTGSSKNQMVLYHSRRRRASRDLDPSARNSQTEGWRPVRLQGYSEDPMKDEVIRGQTQTIRALQEQVNNLEKSQRISVAADQRAREAEEALRQERTNAANQEEMIEQLRNELKMLQTGLGSRCDAEESREPRIKSVQDLGEPDRRRKFRSSSSAEVESLMDLGQNDLEEANVGSPPINRGRRNSFRGSEEHLPKAPPVPLPLNFKKVSSQRRQRKSLPVPRSVEAYNSPDWSNDAPSGSSVSHSQANSPTSLEAKLDFIINSLGISGGNLLSHQQRGRRAPTREFRPPRPRVSKAEGRNERLAWVRSQLHELLGIKQDRDILNNRDIIYAQNTELKRKMAQYEKDINGAGPVKLEPVQVNWDIIHGRWNERLLGLFLIHCKEKGYGGGQLNEEDEDEISEIFFKRLERIRSILNEYRPKDNESIREADRRYANKHSLKLSNARRNRRRGELFNTRSDINMEHLPEDLGSMGHSDEEIRRWVDRFKINEAFGIEGTSSDGTDPYDSDEYFVHTLKWRNKDLARKMRTTDSARRTTNEYGNKRPGNRPRIRKRRAGDESKESVRKIPSGLPINCYDQAWYNGLSPIRKRELAAKPPLQLLATWESD